MNTKLRNVPFSPPDSTEGAEKDCAENCGFATGFREGKNQS